MLYILFYNRIFTRTFDENFASAIRNQEHSLLIRIITFLTAITVVLGMRMMGTLLISSSIVFLSDGNARVSEISDNDCYGAGSCCSFFFAGITPLSARCSDRCMYCQGRYCVVLAVFAGVEKVRNRKWKKKNHCNRNLYRNFDSLNRLCTGTSENRCMRQRHYFIAHPLVRRFQKSDSQIQWKHRVLNRYVSGKFRSYCRNWCRRMWLLNALAGGS